MEHTPNNVTYVQKIHADAGVGQDHVRIFLLKNWAVALDVKHSITWSHYSTIIPTYTVNLVPTGMPLPPQSSHKKAQAIRPSYMLKAKLK